MENNMFTLEPLAPRYPFTFAFERNFDPELGQQWISDTWYLAIAVSLVYLAVLYLYTYKNKATPASQFKEHRLPLFIWNLSICLFSATGAWRTLPELLHSMHYFGFHHTVCDGAYMVKDPVSGFWTFASVLSKAVCLGDTIFLMLRGRPISLLHGFHHASVLVAGWLTYSHKMAAVRWFVFLDFNVNALLYGYFAFRIIGLCIPRPITLAVTAVQILQMVPGTYFSLYSYLCWWYEEDCDVTGASANVALILYVCYLILFLEFFHYNYIERGKADIKKNQ